MGPAARRREEIAALGLLERRPPEVVAHLLNAARMLTGATDAQLNVLTDEAQVTVVDAAGAVTTSPLSDSVCVRVLEHPDDDVQVPDATLDPHYAGAGFVVRGDLVGYAASKLLTSEGVVVGTVCVLSDRRLDLPPHLVAALREIGLSVMAVLEARRTTRSVEAALRASQGRFQLLDRSNEQLSSFAGQVAHDLQGPLATIVFALEWLQEDLGAAEAPRLLGSALRSTTRLAHTIASLLELAQLGGRPELVPVEISAVLGDVLQDLDASRGRTHVEATDLPVVAGVPELLRAVLLNLVGNAFKYAGHVEDPRVRVSVATTDDGWCLAVEDNGPGVRPDDRERIFDPGARGRDDGATRPSGQGIGLATCRRVAEVHGGRVGVGESSLGGARFWFDVPATPAAPPRLRPESEHRP